jgi:molybdopterin-containing oxidoreductase family membrane subunit
MTRIHLLGIFDAGTKAAAAAEALRADRLGEVTAYAPTLDHRIDAALGPGKRPVRVFTLVGGLLGCLLGFAFPIYTVLDWPLITGGKPIVSIPPFVVIAFELTILFAALGTVLGFLISSGLPRLRSGAPYDPRFSDDRWGVLVTCDTGRADAARARLAAAGAEEVRDARA